MFLPIMAYITLYREGKSVTEYTLNFKNYQHRADFRETQFVFFFERNIRHGIEEIRRNFQVEVLKLS